MSRSALSIHAALLRNNLPGVGCQRAGRWTQRPVNQWQSSGARSFIGSFQAAGVDSRVTVASGLISWRRPWWKGR